MPAVKHLTQRAPEIRGATSRCLATHPRHRT
ncbi:hypothetical protein MXAN_4828 [Myxococcus xanthus DK 1622]|uniref:Uncharacterized protein n=1 Tax=Myxococcus xanthus (strain DK1622) TaxID=246197 RepID=Q1D2Y4_MYXXD|nr:hypothetical protein MXAN_4828 [Myxococcus xanthus DK 1622]